MTQSLRDSAWHVFKQIEPDELNGQGEKMYYDVLKCELRQQVVSGDSLHFDESYTRLSPGNRFFLILQDMGKTDDQMTHILGVSEGALRTTRSRLRQKRTAPAKLEG